MTIRDKDREMTNTTRSQTSLPLPENQPAIGQKAHSSRSARQRAQTHTRGGFVLNRSTLRSYLLITLNHVERGNRSLVTPDERISRLTERFTCKSIIICTETHEKGGYHKHVGVWNETASKNTVQHVIRGAFPEFEERQCHVSTHRAWKTICQYVLKQDKFPYIWGEESLEKVRENAGYEQQNHFNSVAPRSKTREVRKIQGQIENKNRARATHAEVLKRLYEKNTWEEVLEDEILGSRCVANCQNIYRLFLELQLLKLRKRLDPYLPALICNLLFTFLRVFYLNQTYMVSFFIIAIISCFISLLNGVDFCIPHILILQGWDFSALFTAEFDFITSAWDCSERPVLDMGEHPSMASGTKPDWIFRGFMAALLSIVGYVLINLKND